MGKCHWVQKVFGQLSATSKNRISKEGRKKGGKELMKGTEGLSDGQTALYCRHHHFLTVHCPSYPLRAPHHWLHLTFVAIFPLPNTRKAWQEREQDVSPHLPHARAFPL